ncbi:uncharacterized protein AMSG_01105 [Thecamonas trahens ATCC 50062]|uniref:Uncharacterized protein n=1 Tax=Thecamonas trahens ATCC 50062 TaxID=461836 RepID=A0A0L0DLK0_THETB|nr:hypothetical protein AMSG_01105 [Thecamonas trahens ATCC 50062]KNC52278.1 hypothetical protein AMSG_01105 [Thecamonas trahens ATCC 50062]|eukprot:XP_013762277.1 hypothetical protein AMSG_01105 [Thecamonas trahens ATCC 50062]
MQWLKEKEARREARRCQLEREERSSARFSKPLDHSKAGKQHGDELVSSSFWDRTNASIETWKATRAGVGEGDAVEADKLAQLPAINARSRELAAKADKRPFLERVKADLETRKEHRRKARAAAAEREAAATHSAILDARAGPKRKPSSRLPPPPPRQELPPLSAKQEAAVSRLTQWENRRRQRLAEARAAAAADLPSFAPQISQRTKRLVGQWNDGGEPVHERLHREATVASTHTQAVRVALVLETIFDACAHGVVANAILQSSQASAPSPQATAAPSEDAPSPAKPTAEATAVSSPRRSRDASDGAEAKAEAEASVETEIGGRTASEAETTIHDESKEKSLSPAERQALRNAEIQAARQRRTERKLQLQAHMQELQEKKKAEAAAAERAKRMEQARRKRLAQSSGNTPAISIVPSSLDRDDAVLAFESYSESSDDGDRLVHGSDQARQQP